MERPSLARVLFVLRVDARLGKAYWIHPPKYHPRLAGTEAGSFRKNQSGKPYCHIHVDCVAIKRSHIVFAAVFGRWPSPCIDHRNGDSIDDRIENIREATVTQNAWNHHSRRKRAALPMGVKKIRHRYQARIGFHGRNFSLGVYPTAEEAARVYQAKRKELYGEFA